LAADEAIVVPLNDTLLIDGRDEVSLRPMIVEVETLTLVDDEALIEAVVELIEPLIVDSFRVIDVDVSDSLVTLES